MAQDVEKAKAAFAEQLFQAMDAITTKRLEHLSYDKTVTCQIIDASDSDKGEYIVSDSVTDFVAYSENASYSEGTWVYVSIPNGDFNQQKHIVGKYVADNTEYFNYKNPLDSYIDITGNLLDFEEDQTFGLIANNNAEDQIILWQIGEMSVSPYSSTVATKEEYLEKVRVAIEQTESGYNAAKQRYDEALANGTISQEDYDEYIEELDELRQEQIEALVEEQSEATNSYQGQRLSHFNRLGIQANFKTFLHKYGLESGKYGLKLYIKTKDYSAVATNPEEQYIVINLSSDEMFGNPYNFFSWSQQQYVFDISEISNIVGMTLVFYQDNNFRDGNGTFIPGYNIYETDGETFTKEWQSYIALKNILVKNIYISLGYDLADFTTDTVLLYSYDSLTYSSYLTENARITVENWNKLQEEPINLNTEEGVQQGLNLVNTKNMYARWIHIDSETGAVQAIDDIDDIGVWENEAEISSLAKIHWYHWNMQDGITSEYGGTFWEELNLNEIAIEQDSSLIEGLTDEEIEKAKQNTYDWFEYENVIPDPTHSFEKYKVIIEYPCKEYLERLVEENIDTYIDNNELAWSEEITNNLYTAEAQAVTGFPNLEQRSAINIELSKRINAERDNYRSGILGNSILYSSPELIFNNEQEVPNQATVDLVRGLELVCDESGYKGVYRIYSTDGQIMNAREATIERTLSARFSEVVVTEEENAERVQNIRWYFPITQTMIETPVDGCEYHINNGTSDYTTFAGIYNQANIDAGLVPAGLGIESNGSWFIIERQGVKMTAIDTQEIGDLVFNTLNQVFRIKSYYTQTASNNTIRCEVYKDNKTYSAEITLYFGVSGSNGTDYTLTVTYEEDTGEVDENNNKIWKPMVNPVFHQGRTTPIRLVPHIFDYNNNEITDRYKGENNDYNIINYSWYSQSVGSHPALTGTKDGKYFIINKTQYDEGISIIKSDFYHYIVQLTVDNVVTIRTPITTEEGIEYPESGITIHLSNCYPIAVSFSDEYISMEGDNRITYDSSGTNPTYFKGQYTLYTNNQEKAVGIQWRINLGNEDISAYRYYPQIDASGQLTVPSIYMIQGNEPTVSILAVNANNQVVWCQPLYISHELYASNFLNSWDGNLNIDNNNNTIMSAMIGAGYKDENNLFNGVLMGTVESVVQSGQADVETGLFGFNQNAVSFGLSVDGKAFFGKKGSGQIRFDGNSGVIKSGNYDWSSTKGMMIDLDDGLIHIKGENGIIKNDDDLSKYPLIIGDSFSVNWSGAMFATAGLIGGWQISQFGLFSDEIQAGDSNFTGIALYGAKSSDTDNSLRIVVGTIELEPAYFIDYQSKPAQTIRYPIYDEEGNQERDPITGELQYEVVVVEPAYSSGIWTKVTKAIYDAMDESVHLKYEDPTYPSESSIDLPSFRVTRGGQVTANQAIFPVASITNATINGTLAINGALVFQNMSYTRRGLTVVTNVTRRKDEQLNVYTRTFYYLGTDPSNQSRKTVKV